MGHSVGLFGEGWELVGVDGELLLEFLDGGAVVEEEDLLRRKDLLARWLFVLHATKFFFLFRDDKGRDGVTYGSVGTLEHVNLLLGGWEVLSRSNALQDLLGDLPQLLMLALEQQKDAGGLGVEGGRGMKDGFLDDFLDTGVRDGRLLLQGVVGAARLDNVEESLSGRHLV